MIYMLEKMKFVSFDKFYAFFGIFLEKRDETENQSQSSLALCFQA